MVDPLSVSKAVYKAINAVFGFFIWTHINIVGK